MFYDRGPIEFTLQTGMSKEKRELRVCRQLRGKEDNL